MENDFVSWQDYSDVANDGRQFSYSPSQLAELNKALTAGSDINSPGAIPGNGFAARIESLEDGLKVLTYKAEHIKFWKMVPKSAAFNTVEEHNELQSYGSGNGGFLDEIDMPEEDDATYQRRYNRVKFMGVTRRVSHVATLVKSAIGNMIAAQTESGTLDLMAILERALHYADSDLSSFQFDGLEKQIRTGGNIIDMRGRPIDEEVLRDGCETVSDEPNYGIPTHFMANTKVIGDFVKGFFPKGRYTVGDGPRGGRVGMDISKYEATTGDVQLVRNTFINDGGSLPLAAAGDPARRPGTPVITTGATTPVDALGLFGAADAGNYRYKIVAMNDRGRSVAVDVGGAIAVAAGDKLTFGVTPSPNTVTKWYALYRTVVGGASGSERLIKRIPAAAGGAELIINDFNYDLPQCSNGFLIQMNADVMAWKQLAPFMKMPLGQLDNSIRWMQLIYGMLVVYQPKKCVLFKNIGRAEGYVGNL